MNVNSVSKETLCAVLSYPFPEGTLANWGDILDWLIVFRETSEITEEYLKKTLILSSNQQKRMFDFLGAKTNVYSICISKHFVGYYIVNIGMF